MVKGAAGVGGGGAALPGGPTGARGRRQRVQQPAPALGEHVMLSTKLKNKF